MESLIVQAFMHVDMIGKEVHEGHFDLIGPDGEIILPQVWETTVQPDWMITMHMWPKPEPPKPKLPAAAAAALHAHVGGGAALAAELHNMALAGRKTSSRHAIPGAKKPSTRMMGIPSLGGLGRMSALPPGIPPPPPPPGGGHGGLPPGIPPPPPPPSGIAAALAAASGNAAASVVKERKSSSGKKKSSSSGSKSGGSSLFMFASGKSKRRK
jgi:hypothetical protein